MSVTMTDGVTDYVQAVRAALADLPAVQREELLDDLSQHLQEVAAETDVPLSVRLGSPAAYAEELRASIGLSADSRSRHGALHRIEARLDRGRQALLHHPTGEAVVDFLPELRPGWWVLRGYLLVAVPSVLYDYTGRGSFPWPTVSGSRVLGLVAALAAIVASVGLGRRTAREPRWRRPVVVGNTLLVLAALVAFTSGRMVSEPPNGFASPSWGGPLTGPDGSSITNIFPYGADGQPLTGVRLYDQAGRPIDNVGDPQDGRPWYERRNPRDAAGNEVTNAYPLVRPPLALDGTPLPGATTAPPLVNVPPLASPTPLASASPQASSSAQASSSPSPAAVSPSPSPSTAPSTASPPPTP